MKCDKSYIIMKTNNIRFMKSKSILTVILGALLLGTVSSCKNEDIEFADYDYQTVYFAHQNVVRPLILGTDIYPRDDDNNHEFQVYVTLGGIWKNKSDRKIQVAVDNSLVEGKDFKNIDVPDLRVSNPNLEESGSLQNPEILTLPSNYYELENTTVVIPKGEPMGSVKVKLTDAFFNDPKSTKITYVLPLRIIDAGSDSILEGKDYVLYAIQYNNKYDGSWLSHGTDEVTSNGTTTTVKRDAEYVEKYAVRHLYTTLFRQVRYPVSFSVGGKTKTCELLLTFDESENCTVTSGTNDVTVSGTGKWQFEAAKNAWGDKDRDQIDLQYNVTFSDGTTVKSTDQLIARDRGAENRALYFTYSE